jgi:hypothetical protein
VLSVYGCHCTYKLDLLFTMHECLCSIADTRYEPEFGPKVDRALRPVTRRLTFIIDVVSKSKRKCREDQGNPWDKLRIWNIPKVIVSKEEP